MEKGEGIMLFGIWIHKHANGGDHLQPPPSTEHNITGRDHQPPKIQQAPRSVRVIKRPRLPKPSHQELPGANRDRIASMGAVEGSLRLVICKAVTKTDTQAHHARLALPRDQLKHNFLTADEEVLIRQKRGTRCHGITVRVVDPSLHERDIRLTRWNSKEDTDKDNENEGSKENKKKKSTSWWYALTGKQWMELLRVNELAEGDGLQLWSFRIQAKDGFKLGFVIHKVQRPPPTPPSNNSSSNNNNNHYSTKRRRRG